MRRRDFLATSIAFTELLAARLSLAKPLVRAAVVIGVDKSGSLPVLSAAASGASAFADWLEGEGFTVKRFVKPPVTVKPISEAIADLVGRGNLDQLVVYFSGHGFLIHGSEMWMLSGAPEDANEAVSLKESIDLARSTTIPHVVFISDACRSVPDSLQVQRVRGNLIFPNRPSTSRRDVAIDRFLAAHAGDPAFELPVAEAVGKFEALYTSCFLDAFERPQSAMVQKLDGVDVVSNWALKTYLVDEVPKRASAKSIQLRQVPDSVVESGEKTYIGRVKPRGSTSSPPPATTPPPPPVKQATVSELAATELARAGLEPLGPSTRTLPAADAARVSAATGFGPARQSIIDAQSPASFESQTGFAVNGTEVTAARSSSGMDAFVLPARDGGPTLIRINPQTETFASVALRFTDGSGTVVAAFKGYIGTLVVDDGRVVSVNYTPSQNNWRSSSDFERLKDLRATVATAARFGAFRIEGDADKRATNAVRLADKIRILKAIDPTLGLYAAYAYAEAGMTEQVRSVLQFMQGDLGTNVFDVAMLAGVLSAREANQSSRVVPFCPMLSQGWGWLRVRGVSLRPELEKARDHLRPALWTTFDKTGMEIIEGLIRAL